jgi:hypothetical protein
MPAAVATLRPIPADGSRAPARPHFPTKQNQGDRFLAIWAATLIDCSWPNPVQQAHNRVQLNAIGLNRRALRFLRYCINYVGLD